MISRKSSAMAAERTTRCSFEPFPKREYRVESPEVAVAVVRTGQWS